MRDDGRPRSIVHVGIGDLEAFVVRVSAIDTNDAILVAVHNTIKVGRPRIVAPTAA